MGAKYLGLQTKSPYHRLFVVFAGPNPVGKCKDREFP